MALQAQTSGSPEISFAAADCDGLSFRDAIHGHVIGPDVGELCSVIGATRTDGWMWLQPVNFNTETYADDDRFDDEKYDYAPIYEDGTFIADVPDEGADIIRDGIGGYRCRRISSKLRPDPRGLLHVLYNLRAGGLEWPVDLTVEELIHVVKSWSKFAETPPAFDAVKTVAKGIAERWMRLLGYINKCELVAVGMNSARRRERLRLERYYLIDIRTGHVSARGKNGWGETTRTGDWSDVLLTVPSVVSADCSRGAAPEAEPRQPLTQPVLDAVNAIEDQSAVSDEVKQNEKKPTNCRGWLAEQMRASPELRPMRKSEYLSMAQKKFTGLSERSFDRAWGVAIHDTGSQWGRHGAPRKNPRT